MFDFLKITNGHVKLKGKASAEPFGCTGSLSVETELRPIVKRCEGETVKEKNLIDSMSVTLSAHVKTSILREVYGLSNKGLKTGVYGYGQNSIGTEGTYTFEAIDMDGEKVKYIAFPNLTPATGLKINYENGQDEIAEIEIEFKAMPDENGYRYYETFKDDIKGVPTLATWHDKFSSTAVKE